MTTRAKRDPKAALYHRVAARHLATGATCLKYVRVGLPARSYLRRTTHYPISFVFHVLFTRALKRCNEYAFIEGAMECWNSLPYNDTPLPKQ